MRFKNSFNNRLVFTYELAMYYTRVYYTGSSHLKIKVFSANVKKSYNQGLDVRFAVWGSRLYG